ncbi:hypothetical protein KBD49_05240 [Myxococcota bacterium]|nr:hypothetical protein [Myxococcota bacterium]
MEGNSATFDAGFLEGSGTVSIRVLATDGIRTAQDQVDHLRAPDRPPVVRVAWPAPGDAGGAGDTLDPAG